MECNKIGLGSFTARIKCAKLFASGLITQSSWRSNDPQTEPKPRKQLNLTPKTCAKQVCATETVDWGHGLGAKEKAPCCAFLGLAQICGYPILRLGLKKPRTIRMIYTFIVAHSSQKLAQLKKLRTVSTFAHSEEQARKNFPGMPLVLQARTHAHRMQGGAA